MIKRPQCSVERYNMVIIPRWCDPNGRALAHSPHSNGSNKASGEIEEKDRPARERLNGPGRTQPPASQQANLCVSAVWGTPCCSMVLFYSPKQFMYNHKTIYFSRNHGDFAANPKRCLIFYECSRIFFLLFVAVVVVFPIIMLWSGWCESVI